MIIDNTVEISKNKIIIDESVNIDKLGWKAGDCFKVTNINGQAMLVKLEPIEQFIKGLPVNKNTP